MSRTHLFLGAHASMLSAAESADHRSASVRAAPYRFVRKADRRRRALFTAIDNTLLGLMSKPLREIHRKPVRRHRRSRSSASPRAAGLIGPEADPGPMASPAPMCFITSLGNRDPLLSQLFTRIALEPHIDQSGRQGVAAPFWRAFPALKTQRQEEQSRLQLLLSTMLQGPPLVEINPSCCNGNSP